MKRVITSAVFVISFVSLLDLGLVSRVQAGQCSNTSFKGSYGVICEGTVIDFGPFVSIAVETADGAGQTSGTFTQSFNGVISTGTFTSTYAVNADCTGTQEVTLSDGLVLHLSFVIQDNKKEILFIYTDPGLVAKCVETKQ
jgi:hypothetical protein